MNDPNYNSKTHKIDNNDTLKFYPGSRPTYINLKNKVDRITWQYLLLPWFPNFDQRICIALTVNATLNMKLDSENVQN